jgi:hypothetical protein
MTLQNCGHWHPDGSGRDTYIHRSPQPSPTPRTAKTPRPSSAPTSPLFVTSVQRAAQQRQAMARLCQSPRPLAATLSQPTFAEVSTSILCRRC